MAWYGVMHIESRLDLLDTVCGFFEISLETLRVITYDWRTHTAKRNENNLSSLLARSQISVVRQYVIIL
jgi:hypothetical protein